MSRTNAHVPLHVRIARRNVPYAEVHDHTDGVCDLPDPYIYDRQWSGRGHCHWTWVFDGRGICPCNMCHGGDYHRADRRADRQRIHRQLRAVALNPDLADEL